MSKHRRLSTVPVHEPTPVHDLCSCVRCFLQIYLSLLETAVPSAMPRITAIRQRLTLSRILRTADFKWPDCHSCIVSRENAEKVVNAPRSPVWKNSLGPCAILGSRKILPASKPIRNEPETFATNVPKGKLSAPRDKTLTTRYLSVAPHAPPSATHRMATIRCPKRHVQCLHKAIF